MIFIVLKILPLLIYGGVLGFIYRNKSLEEAYFKLQQLSIKVIEKMGFNVKAFGVENIPDKGPVLFLSNHQGTIDPAIVVATCKLPVSFISKKENEKLPILGRWARNIQSIHFDRTTREGNIYMIRNAIKYIKEGKNILVFPEGTRSKSDKMNEFKQGSLQLAYLTKADIIPVTLNNAYCLDVRGSDKTISIHYGKVIRYSEYKDYSYDKLNELVYKEIESKIKK